MWFLGSKRRGPVGTDPTERTAHWRWRLLGLAAGTAGVLGSTWLAIRACRWMGWPPATAMVFEGRWYAASWEVFPWAEAIVMVVLMAAVPLALDAGAGWRERPVGRTMDGRTLAWTAIAIAIGAGCFFLRPLIATEHTTAPGNHPSVLVTFWLVVAVAEEATFRGFLQRRLTDLVGPSAAVAGAGVAFTLWHGWPQPWALLGVRFAGGIVLGLLYFWSGRLLTPVVGHWTANVAMGL